MSLIDKIKHSVKKKSSKTNLKVEGGTATKSDSPPSSPTETRKESKDKDNKEKDTKKKKREDTKSATATKTPKAERTTSRTEGKDSPKSREPTTPKQNNTDANSSATEGESELVADLCSAHKVAEADFELLKVIGKGSFGKVMQVRHMKSRQIYAMKVMRKDHIVAKHQVNHTKDERHILQKISHPFIVKLNYAFQSKDKLYMILDYVNGGELFTHLKRCGRFSEERARFYCAELCLALMHLHNSGIVYRDLKPENILLGSDGHIVLTDFGLSKYIGDKQAMTFCGTPEYLAPEVLLGQGQSYPVDWWSLGTLTYEMICGLPPFYSEIQSEMYDLIVNGELAFPPEISDDACDFLAGLLEKEPDQRLLPDEIKSHPWFEGIDWEALEKKQIEPQWKPNVKDVFDYTQFDEEVLNEAPSSLNKPSALDGLEDMFPGFTYERKDNALNSAITTDSQED